ncbi:MAG: transcription antitermination factor NusB [Clostridia bacterium]|nr:transcription antitermination factor NusB [Clostridia bacterium]
MSRKTAREVAMKLAFARLLGGDDTYESVLEESGIKEVPTDDDVAYSNMVLEGIAQHSDEIDAKIDEFSIDWRKERMPKVDFCILRIAMWEMLYCEEIPERVSINEAVELAKQFGGDHSPSFINGVLGALSKAEKAAE